MTLNVPTIRHWIALACVMVLAAGTLAACGSDDDSSSDGNGAATTTAPDTSGGGSTTTGDGGGGGATTALALSADESGGLSFSKKTLTAKAGSVTIDLDNPSDNQLPHAVEVEGNGVEEETATIQPGEDASVTVDLEPGTYEFYCPVGNHRAAGMEGTLTVQ